MMHIMYDDDVKRTRQEKGNARGFGGVDKRLTFVNDERRA